MPQLNETLEAKGDDPLEEDAVSRIHEETEAHLQAYLAGAPSLGVGGKGGGEGRNKKAKSVLGSVLLAAEFTALSDKLPNDFPVFPCQTWANATATASALRRAHGKNNTEFCTASGRSDVCIGVLSAGLPNRFRRRGRSSRKSARVDSDSEPEEEEEEEEEGDGDDGDAEEDEADIEAASVSDGEAHKENAVDEEPATPVASGKRSSRCVDILLFPFVRAVCKSRSC